VQQSDEDKRQIQFFVKERSLFAELPLRFIPERLRSNIEMRMGELGLSSSYPNAA
jgi:hypothetical protein